MRKLGNVSHAVMHQRHEAHDSLPIISRKEAKALGQAWFFTGKSCIRGHVAKRNCTNAECRRCVDERVKRKRAEDPTKLKAKDKRKYDRNPEKMRQRNREQYAKHSEKRRAYDQRRYLENPKRREQCKRKAVAWGRNNPGKRNHTVAQRRAWIKRATPRWLSDGQREEIRQFYLRAKALGPDHHVDHIVPLRGQDVCGLNVPWNLQVLTKAENLAKGNRYEA